jgi:phage repressor protein C with HTH and peptisase S24 domain
MERSRTRHERLWAAIDAIAARHGLSPSGLARRAGLDATAFNRSKRFTADGRPRWPSTESIAKILAATGSQLWELVHLIDGETVRPGGTVGFSEEAGPLLGAEPLGRSALRVADDAMMPLYRAGDVLIVSDGEPIRPGDRVVLRIDRAAPVARVFVGRAEDGLAFAPIVGGEAEVLAAGRIAGLARILWASQ